MKKVSIIFLVMLLIAAMMTSCSSSTTTTTASETASTTTSSTTSATTATSSSSIDFSKLTIAWSPANLTNELQVTLTDDLTAQLEALGAKVLTADPSSDATKQVQQVENYISQGVDMILMSPVDASASGVVVTEAAEAKIPIMIVNCKLDNLDEALCYVGCDDSGAGTMLMQYVSDQLGAKGNIAILRGPDGLDAQIKRTAGFDEILKTSSGIKVFDSQAANWKTDVAMSICEDWLQTTTLNAIVCENDEMAIGAVEAVKGQGLSLDDVMVVGIDGIASAVDSIAKGEMRATLLQDANAIASKTVEVIQKYFKGDSIDAEYIIDWTLIDSKNVSEFQK